MSHESFGEAPKPPEGESPQLTSPDMSCLEEGEILRIKDATHAVMTAVRGDSQTVFNMAMDNFAAMGAHLVGHGLNAMVWSAYQVAMMINGQQPHDAQGAHVTITPDGEQVSQAMVDITDMAAEFVQATISGAHASAMETWGKWVDSLEEGDWQLYQHGICMVMGQAIYIATSVTQEGDETAKLVYGDHVQQLVQPFELED